MRCGLCLWAWAMAYGVLRFKSSDQLGRGPRGGVSDTRQRQSGLSSRQHSHGQVMSSVGRDCSVGRDQALFAKSRRRLLGGGGADPLRPWRIPRIRLLVCRWLGRDLELPRLVRNGSPTEEHSMSTERKRCLPPRGIGEHRDERHVSIVGDSQFAGEEFKYARTPSPASQASVEGSCMNWHKKETYSRRYQGE